MRLRASTERETISMDLKEILSDFQFLSNEFLHTISEHISTF